MTLSPIPDSASFTISAVHGERRIFGGWRLMTDASPADKDNAGKSLGVVIPGKTAAGVSAGGAGRLVLFWAKPPGNQAITMIKPGIQVNETAVFIETQSQLAVLIYNAESSELTQAKVAIFNVRSLVSTEPAKLTR
jgi:hypothetical protein